MTDRPILFSGPMVRALLAGRKTQTRRVVKPQPPPDAGAADLVRSRDPETCGRWGWLDSSVPGEGLFLSDDYFRCPYGRPGDRLWVRETWSRADTPSGFAYCADTPDGSDQRGMGWRPSIHMPRGASRLSLLVTEVRVQRLQDICEADAAAEGLMTWQGRDCDGDPRLDGRMYDFTAWGWQRPTHEDDGFWSAYAAYRDLWNHINGRDSWDANPWVWAVSFEVEARP